MSQDLHECFPSCAVACVIMLRCGMVGKCACMRGHTSAAQLQQYSVAAVRNCITVLMTIFSCCSDKLHICPHDSISVVAVTNCISVLSASHPGVSSQAQRHLPQQDVPAAEDPGGAAEDDGPVCPSDARFRGHPGHPFRTYLQCLRHQHGIFSRFFIWYGVDGILFERIVHLCVICGSGGWEDGGTTPGDCVKSG